MVRKTRRHFGKNKKGAAGIYSIPELRRSFEHIEEFVDKKIASKEGKERIAVDLRKEWQRVFMKDLDKKSAEAFIDSAIEKSHTHRRHRTLKRRGGAAPVLSDTRPGLYLASGKIPDSQGQLPLSSGGKSSFGFYVPYVDKGFWNPEPAISYDPVPGQTHYVTAPPKGMGTNDVHFSAKGGATKRNGRTLRKRRGGSLGATLSQAFTRPIPSSVPSGVLQDAQDMWYGKEVGPSPDQVQRSPTYQLGSVYPKVVTF
jgi:hypothetical protein